MYIFNSWNLDCDPGFHGVFCKTKITRQLKKLNESKIEKIRKNTDKNRWNFISMFTCDCNFVSVWASAYACMFYSYV